VHTSFGPFSPLLQPPPSPPHFPHFQAGPCCTFLQFCWLVDISNNKKDNAFLLVEIRIAIQRDS
jgi:hypothetical protein